MALEDRKEVSCPAFCANTPADSISRIPQLQERKHDKIRAGNFIVGMATTIPLDCTAQEMATQAVYIIVNNKMLSDIILTNIPILCTIYLSPTAAINAFAANTSHVLLTIRIQILRYKGIDEIERKTSQRHIANQPGSRSPQCRRHHGPALDW